MRPVHEKLAVALLVIVFAGISVTSALRKSATVEEVAHIAAGLYTWKTYDFSLFSRRAPISRLFATFPLKLFKAHLETDLDRYPESPFRPWLYGTDFISNNIERYGLMLLVARLMVILFGICLCLVVWRTAREGFGEWGGIFALACCALSPTLIAHTRLVTPDVLAALFSIIFLISLINYLDQPKTLTAAKMAVALGIAIGSRFSCLIWVPFALAAPPFAALSYVTERLKRPGPFRTAFHMFIIILLTWVAIICCYFGSGVGLHSQLRLESRPMKAMAPLARTIPLPREFIQGLDRQIYDAGLERWNRGAYLFGEWHKGGKWYYYVVAAGLKEPVSHLLIFLLTLFTIAFYKTRDRDEFVLLIAIVSVFALGSLSGSSQKGIRYLLLVYPAAFILMGKLAGVVFEPFPAQPTGPDGKPLPIKLWRKALSMSQKIFLGVVCAWMLFQHALIWPDYIPYFNIVSQRLADRHELLLDSNLDWGQDLPGLAGWMKKNDIADIDLAYYGHDDPGRFNINYTLPARGSENEFIAISASFLMGKKHPMTFWNEEIDMEDPLWAEVERYRGEVPVEVIGHSIFVFEKLP
jgi:hypothetical protein